MTLYEFLKPFIMVRPAPSLSAELWMGGGKVYEGELRKIPALYVIHGYIVYKANIEWCVRKLVIVIDGPEEGET